VAKKVGKPVYTEYTYYVCTHMYICVVCRVGKASFYLLHTPEHTNCTLYTLRVIAINVT